MTAVTPAAGDLREALRRQIAALTTEQRALAETMAAIVEPVIVDLAAAQARVAEVERERDEFADLVGQYAAEQLPEGMETLAKDRDKWFEQAVAAQARADRFKEALLRIVQGADAYPTNIFTPPDYPAIRTTLHAKGFVPGHTLDGIAADCMRRAMDGVGAIARTALARTEASTESTGEPDA